MTSGYSRQQAAEELRSNLVFARHYDRSGEYSGYSGPDKTRESRCTLYNDIANSVEPLGNIDLTAEQVFERLAKLVDPTCHVTDKQVVVELADGTRTIGRLLSCGHAYFGEDVPNYCPVCGSRVVSQDETR